MRPRTALVTANPRAQVRADADLPLLREAVEEAGSTASITYWDDPDVDWGQFDLVVLRSTWDYSWRAAEFLDWVDGCGSRTTLANPPAVLRWNADKHYLGELAAHGVPVVRTHYLEPGDVVELPRDTEYVVKPATSAGARLAARYQPEEKDAALQHVQQLHAKDLTALVQPYQRQIDSTGERALVFYGGQLVHAARKDAVLDPGVAADAQKTPHPAVRRWTPSEAELAVAQQALAAVPGGAEQLLYGRVDLADDELGAPQVMELELIEPNLFLSLVPQSLPVVGSAIAHAAAAAAGTHRPR